MEWNAESIMKYVGGTGIFTLLTMIVGKAMGWIRFGKVDKAKVGKVQSETAIDIATVTQKKIEDEVKISGAALQWAANFAAQTEKANAMNERLQTENERLHSVIDTMKANFEKAIEKIKEDFYRQIKELEADFIKSKDELIKRDHANREEIKRLKAQIDGQG